jgi:hypothetical protein
MYEVCNIFVLKESGYWWLRLSLSVKVAVGSRSALRNRCIIDFQNTKDSIEIEVSFQIQHRTRLTLQLAVCTFWVKKVKLSQGLSNLTLRHEDIWVEWMYRYTFSWPSRLGRFTPGGKRLRYPLARSPGGLQSRSLRLTSTPRSPSPQPLYRLPNILNTYFNVYERILYAELCKL